VVSFIIGGANPVSWNKSLVLLICYVLSNCVFAIPAPIVEGWHQPPAKKSNYIVQKGDTLYSVAWAFDMDFRDLARINLLKPPYHLVVGQILYMSTVALPSVGFKDNKLNSRVRENDYERKNLPAVVMRPNLAPPIRTERKFLHLPQRKQVQLISPKKITYAKPKNWVWPTQGKIIRGFSKISGGNHGIEIAGKTGQPILAAAAGRVVYAGSGLRGYGNLIIIKHNDSYLSAYAYNKNMLVKEGTWVNAGQRISSMGQNNSGKVLLHFEIRRNGKPINPMQFLS
jgi:lipoprotein NlpD